MSNALLYIVTVSVWGSTWIAIEFQLGTVAPEVSVFYRFSIASMLLFGWCKLRGLRLDFDWRAHGRFVLLGMLLFGLNYVVTYYAQVHITSALTAISFSTMLWMNIINTRIFFGVRAGTRVIAGSLLGVAGIVLLFLPEVGELSMSDATVYGASLCIVGALIASMGNMVSQDAQNKGLPVVQSNAWGMFYGALVTGAVAHVQGQEFIFDSTPPYLLSLLYLAVFGSIVGFGSYLTLLGRIGAHRAGYTMVMFPVVALLLSWIFEGLQFSAGMLIGVVLVLLGNLFILAGDSETGASPEASTGPARGLATPMLWRPGRP